MPPFLDWFPLSSFHSLSKHQLLASCSSPKYLTLSIQDLRGPSLIHIFPFLHLSRCPHLYSSITTNFTPHPWRKPFIFSVSTSLLILCSLLGMPQPHACHLCWLNSTHYFRPICHVTSREAFPVSTGRIN